MAWKNDTQTHISIVVPIFHAGGDLHARLQRLEHFIDASRLKLELILVDDGCDETTRQELMQFASDRHGVSLITHNENLGKGRSVADGVAAANGQTIVFTDIDLPYELVTIERMHELLDRDPRPHMLVGSRRHSESELQTPYGISRRTASWVFGKLTYALAGVKGTDVQCGIKGFRKDVARLLFSDLIVSRFAFDVELFVRAQKFGLHIEEVPVVFQHTPESTVSLVPSSIQMFRDIMRIRKAYAPKRP